MKLPRRIPRHIKLLRDYITESEGRNFEEHIYSGGKPEDHILWHFLCIHHFLTGGKRPETIVAEILRR